MQKYILHNDQPVFGKQVKTFPQGISETFDALSKMIQNGEERSYYGISYFHRSGNIIYTAAALEKYEGEAEKYNCERYIIEKGNYLTETIHDWHTNLTYIKEVFHKMMKDNRVDNTKPCIVWYKSEYEMLCMIKAREPMQ